jgi:hypothetical protein
MISVWGVARADFIERLRRFSFIAIMALSFFAAFWFVPRDDGSIQVMAIKPDRFVQAGNPSWIPVASAWGLGFFLPLIGFFYLRNTLAFDEKSGVSQLILPSPIGNLRYMLGKLCSGTLLLYCFTAIVMTGSFFMMLWHFPGQILSAYDFLSPFLFLLLSLPFCAALALFFESVRFLRGAFGSVIFVIAFFSVYVMVSMADEPSFLLRSFDFSGTSLIYQCIKRAVLEQSGAPMDTLLFLGSAAEDLQAPTMHLVFNGVPVSTADIQGFAGMLCVTLGLAVFSAPLYSLSNKLSVVKLPKKDAKKGMATAVGREAAASYAPVSPSAKNMWIRGIFSELILMLSGQPFIWKLISFGAMIACLFMDLGMVQKYILPLALLCLCQYPSSYLFIELPYDFRPFISAP